MSMASSNALLHFFFKQDNQNEVQPDFFGHVIHLVMTFASCDADGVVNGKNAFVSSR